MVGFNRYVSSTSPVSNTPVSPMDQADTMGENPQVPSRNSKSRVELVWVRVTPHKGQAAEEH